MAKHKKIKSQESIDAHAPTLGHPSALGVADTLAAPEAPIPINEPLKSEVGRYLIEGEIARGGLGKILRARDQKLERPVAIKQLLRTQGDQGRFFYEALTTAKLQHPAIIPVYEAGRWDDGEPYFAMKYVSGKPFDRVIEETRSLDERLILLPCIINVCDAIAYAHSQKIIHRDLKPHNILLGEFGETVVIDWGLAKDLASKERGKLDPSTLRAESAPSAPELTLAGAVVGTPMYMPPEQAAGQNVDERADVYSLGAILYHLLAGGPPFQGKSSLEILRGLSQQPPPPLQERQPGAPRDLVTIVNKAMSRDPAARYPTAKELAEELRRFQNGQLVQSHNYTWWQRLRRLAIKNKALVAIASVALLAVAGFLSQAARVYQTNQKLTISEQKLREENLKTSQLMEEKIIQAEALRQGMIAQTVSLSKEQLDRSPLDTLRNLLRAWESNMQPLSDAQWALVRNLAAQAIALPLPRLVVKHNASATIALFSSDERSVISVGDGALHVTPLDGGASRRLPLSDKSAISSVVALPDGQHLLSATFQGTVRRWSLSTGQSELLVEGSVLKNVVLSPDSTMFVGVTKDEVKLLRVTDGAPLYQILAPGVQEVSFSAAGLMALRAEGSVELWSWGTGKRQLLPESQGILSAVLTRDGSTMFSVDALGDVCRWSLSNPKKERLGSLSLFDLTARIYLSSSGRWLIVSTADEVWLFDTSKSEPTLKSIRLRGKPERVEFSSSDDVLAVGNNSGIIQLFDPWTETRTLLRGHQQGIWSLAFSSDGRLLSSSDDGSVFIWSPSFRAPEDTALKPRHLSPDGETVLLEDAAGKLFLRDPRGLRALQRDPGVLKVIRFSRDGRWLAIGTESALSVYNVASGEGALLREGWCSSADFSPDGASLVVAAGERVELWELSSKRSTLLFSHEANVSAVAFSPDGAQIASAGYDQKLYLYSRGEARVTQSRAFSSLIFRDLAFSPRRDVLVAGGADGILRFFSLQDLAAPPVERRGHNAMVYRLLFSPDGDALLTLDVERTALLWELTRLPPKDATWQILGDAAVGIAISDERASLLDRRGFVSSYAAHLPPNPDELRALILSYLPK